MVSKSLAKAIALGVLDSTLNIIAGSVLWVVLFLTFPPFVAMDISFLNGFSTALGLSAVVILSRDLVIQILHGLVKLKTYLYNRRLSK